MALAARKADGFSAFNPTYALAANKKSPAENRGAFDLKYRERGFLFRPWQTWQRPTLPSLET
jgi:hypothetical protein